MKKIKNKFSNLKLRTRTKVLIPFLIAFILSSPFLSADVTQIHGTNDSGDSWYGPIDTIRIPSTGRCWEANASNLQDAIWSLNGTGGIVQIPKGTFDLTALEISIADLNNLTIRGEGRGVTILQNGGIIKNDADATYNVKIEDLTIDINNITGRTGINLATNCFNFHINNVEIKNTNNSFLLYFSNVNRLLVENCIFYDGGLGVAKDNVAGSQLTATNDTTIFRNNWFIKENSLGGGLLTTGGTGNLLIEGNTFSDLSNTSYAAISIENSYGACKDIQVFNNHVYGVGICVGNNFTNLIEYVEITNNMVKGNGPNPGGNGVIKGIGEKVIMQGNIISDTVYGILAGCPTGVAGEIIISDNVLKNTNIYNGGFTSDRGIYLATSDEKLTIKVSDNIFTDDAGTTPYGIRAAALPNASLYVENNILEGPFTVAPVSISSTLDLLVLTDNRINGTPSFGSTTTKVILDNTGYETVFPTVNVSTAQVGYAYTSGSGVLVKTSGGWVNLTLDTDTTYTSGDGLNLSGTVFSINGSIFGDNLVWDGSFVNATDSAGDYDPTLIWNSNGNNWTVNGTNVHVAVDDLGLGYGWVKVGDDVTLTSPITLENYTSLDFMGHNVTLSGEYTGLVNMSQSEYCVIENVNVIVPQHSNASVIHFYCPPGDPGSPNKWNSKYNIFRNIKIYNQGLTGTGADWIDIQTGYGSHNYTGIHFECNSKTGLAHNYFYNIEIHYAWNGVLFEMNNGTTGANDGWFNNNNFYDLWTDRCVVHINFTRGLDSGVHATGAISACGFFNWKLQCGNLTQYYLKNESGINCYYQCYLWDWSKAVDNGNAVYQIWFGEDSQYAEMHAASFIQDEYFLNEGVGLNLYRDGGRMYDYRGYSFIISKEGDYNVLINGSTGKVIKIDTNFSEVLEKARDDSYKGGSILLRNGEYVFNNPDIFSAYSEDFTLIGENKYYTKIIAGSSFPAHGIMLWATAGVEENITLKNIWWDGNGTGAKPFVMRSVENMLIDNCIFKNWTSEPIQADLTTTPGQLIDNLVIRDCIFDGLGADSLIVIQGQAGYENVTNVTIKDNTFSGKSTHSIYMNYAKDSLIYHNTFSNSSTNAIKIDHSNNITIENNIISSGAADGINIDDSVNCTILSNTVRVVDDGIWESGTCDFNMFFFNKCGTCGDPITETGANNIPVTPGDFNFI